MINQKQTAPFGLRMPPELKNWVHKVAERNRRSVNSEIVMRLEESRARDEEKQNAVQG